MERAPAVAGRFYPGDAAHLAEEVRRCLGPTFGDERALAVIAPHAGYVYSGSIAGEVFARVHVPEVAIVLCPNHTGLGVPDAIMTEGIWRIPGARVPIDEPIAREIAVAADLTEDARAHLREHALEVMLPFLVARNPDVRIVPICLGPLPLSHCTRIGHAIASVMRRHPGEILLVASSDMSHYIPATVARARDALALARVEAVDPEGLYRTVEREGISMCGYVPATVALTAAFDLGAHEGRLVRYGNSGEVSGDYEQVVGYAGMIID